ncbi:nucleoside deaminase [Oceanihabitans sp. IOP_32]|uniref:nucleoside deaminase n=1 Tax=Oceanihabitans sp. IOP_32 TaxID=2529032 RepID=UPI001D170336|nr:nucleoside deaminase [Oceanihabitans sp. IOP_32]
MNHSEKEKFMLEAVNAALKGMQNNEGGPFGCIIVKNGTIIGRGHNRVTSTNDPTAHAEITAIRDACKNLNSFQLEGCEIYTSCEPCPMCLGFIGRDQIKSIMVANILMLLKLVSMMRLSTKKSPYPTIKEVFLLNNWAKTLQKNRLKNGQKKEDKTAY